MRSRLFPGSASGLSRRNFLRATGGALLAASPVLAACGGGGSGDAKELSFWNFYGPNDSSPNPQERRLSEWFTKTVEAWNANNEVTVKLRYLPVADYLAGTTLQTAFSSGEGPDISSSAPVTSSATTTAACCPT